MTITRVGTTKKYAENWAQAFGGKKGKSAASTAARPAPKKKSAKTKAVGKKQK